MYELTIAIGKGRVLQAFETLWTASGWPWPVPERRLWFPPTTARPGFIIARGPDIPFLVERGAAAFGVVGEDVLREQQGVDVLELLDLACAPCRMVLAASQPRWPVGPVQVATKYPRVTRQFFAQRSQPVDIVSLSGSLEMAPHLGLAPYIVDVVQTGRTLREHHLHEVATLFPSTARLIVNPAVWRLRAEAQAIQAQLAKAVKHQNYVEELS